MSITPKVLRQMRIIAIPLTRPIVPKHLANSQHNRILTYYQFQITSPPKPTVTNDDGGSTNETGRSSWIPEGGIGKWITTKAADTWASFGKAKGGWKLKTYQTGERLVDRMDFEELALKGIDPSLGPTVTHPGVLDKEAAGVSTAKLRIPLVFPSSINSGSVTLEELRALVAYRTPRHRRGFLGWILLAPITAPFMIIPIIPNLPFFFCIWRAWSHYKAYRSSQYLQSLLDSGAIVPEESVLLDSVYKDYAMPINASATPLHEAVNETTNSENSTSSTTSPQHAVLLTRDAVPAILSIFNLKSAAGADLLRAVEQARVRVKSGRGTL